jgi:prevent-host-death family protein
MAEMIPVSEAKARLSELVRRSDETDVFLMRHGRVAGVIISSRRYDAMLEEAEDLRDRLSVYEAEGVAMSLDKLEADLGLTVND